MDFNPHNFTLVEWGYLWFFVRVYDNRDPRGGNSEPCFLRADDP